MYLDYFGLDEAPFRITPHTDFFFAGANRGATLEALLYAITHDEGIVKVSGEVGSGKTMLCRVLMERLPGHVRTILLSNPAISRDEIIYAIAEELDLRPQGDRLSSLLLKLQEHLITLYGNNQRVVLLIDEAHAMPQETLEQIRLLSNLESSRSKLLQIVLFGQPELDQHLGMPHMRQLKERITQSFRLEALLRTDVEAYLDFRMRAAGYRGPNVFGPGAVRRIVKASEGLTRRVNILADKSLLAAFADNEHGITARHVNRAIRDSEFCRSPMSYAKIGLAAGGVAAGLALGLTLHFLLSPAAPTPGAAALGTVLAQPAALAPPAQPTETPGAAIAQFTSRTTPGTAAAGAAPMAMAPIVASTLTTAATSIVPATPATAATPIIPAASATPATSVSPTSDAKQHTNSAAAATNSASATAKIAAVPAPIVKPASNAQNSTVRAEPATGAPAAATPAAEPQVQAAARPGSKNYVPPAPPAGNLTRGRFTATQEWLKGAPGDYYSIQLLTAGAHDIRRLEELLARAAEKHLRLSDFYIYGVKINDQQHYRLAYGLYPTLAEATQGIRDLPAVYLQFGPYYRSVERMRSQNHQ